jgi:hypothetical protein
MADGERERGERERLPEREAEGQERQDLDPPTDEQPRGAAESAEPMVGTAASCAGST